MINGSVAIWLALLGGLLAGYLIARRGTERVKGLQVDKLRRNYFRGLNFLLNEQPDKAIEVFLQIAEVDNHTVETHLALGSLFRRRGEADRAIRLHQNLIARPNLTADQKSVALLELGEDYMRAGLLDRAEVLFTDLLTMDAYAAPALRQLISICQQERDWFRAIEHARRLEKITGDSQGRLIAHFLSEIANVACQKGDAATAENLIREAIQNDRNAVRPRLIEGRLAMQRSDWRNAANAFEKALDNDVDFVPEALPQIILCLEKLHEPARIRSYLESLSERYPGVSPVLALARRIEEEEGIPAATQFLSKRLRQRPSVRGLAALVELQIQASQGEAREQLMSLRELFRQLIADQAVYRCNYCGFGARSHFWQCPGCKNWGSIKPVHGVAGD
jgi:lipopolysaccharide assembly protein B